MKAKLQFAERTIRERIRLDQDRVGEDVRAVLVAIDAALLDARPFKNGVTGESCKPKAARKGTVRRSLPPSPGARG